MSFIDEIGAFLKTSSASFRYQIIGGLGGYFEGVRSIPSLDGDKVVFEIKRGKITVEGKNLNVEKYYGDDVMLTGEIVRVTNDELR